MPIKTKYLTSETVSAEHTHFAAANSGYGFVSYYKEVFGSSDIKRRYIIKGGPGPGKSSFMKRVAEYAEEKGRQVEYFRCSSDPASLDGIIIDGKLAMLDGTAPHTYEPHIAGACDEIVDLGQFWDSDKLYESYNEIAALSAMKSNAYTGAYKFLSAAMNIEDENRSLASGLLLRDKMTRAVERIFRSLPLGRGFSLKHRLVNAIGMGGLAHIDSFEREAERLYVIYDSYGLGSEFLSAVIDAAMEKQQSVCVSYEPLMPGRPDGVMLTDVGIAFVINEYPQRDGAVKINMGRFVDRNEADGIKPRYKANERLVAALILSATDRLADAGEYHFRLEKIYTSCMDFEAEDGFISSFCRKHI